MPLTWRRLWSSLPGTAPVIWLVTVAGLLGYLAFMLSIYMLGELLMNLAMLERWWREVQLRRTVKSKLRVLRRERVALEAAVVQRVRTVSLVDGTVYRPEGFEVSSA